MLLNDGLVQIIPLALIMCQAFYFASHSTDSPGEDGADPADHVVGYLRRLVAESFSEILDEQAASFYSLDSVPLFARDLFKVGSHQHQASFSLAKLGKAS